MLSLLKDRGSKAVNGFTSHSLFVSTVVLLNPSNMHFQIFRLHPMHPRAAAPFFRAYRRVPYTRARGGFSSPAAKVSVATKK